MDLNKELTKVIAGVVDEIKESVAKQTDSIILETINARLRDFDYSKHITHVAAGLVKDQLQEVAFDKGSIDPGSLNMEGFKWSGNNIHGGIITEFSSTGIDDRATNIAVTILDDVTVVENNLLTKDLTVQGNIAINGTLDRNSGFYQELVDTVSTNTVNKLDKTLFDGFSNTIFNTIKNNGIDVDKVTINGNEIVNKDTLGGFITKSRLREVGQLTELQVQGETFLSESLYTGKGRVGVNTIEPGAALSVWDQEVEVHVSKKSSETAFVGTPRSQSVVLGANNKNNITLNTDGSASVNDLRIGQTMKFTEGDRAPNYTSTKGHVVWNSNPSVGGPLGWICIGGPNWANFGIID